MLKRYLALTDRDLRLIWRNYFFHAIWVLMLICVVAIRFAVPAEVSVKPAVVLWDTTAGQVAKEYFASKASGEGAALILVESAAAFEEALATGDRIGVRATGGDGLETFELVYQGHESERMKQLLSATMHLYAAEIGGPESGYPEFEHRVLRPGTAPPRIAFDDSMVPFVVFTEGALIGMLLAAALLYSEKDERSLRAYRTSPGGLAEYILARSTAMAVLGMAFTVPLSLLTVGFIGNWPAIALLVCLGCMVTTMLTLVVANTFENLSQFIYPAFALIFVLTLPTAPYFSPSVNLPWIRVLPTYPLLFALREAYFMPGQATGLWAAVVQLAASAAVLFPLATLTFRRQLIARDV